MTCSQQSELEGRQRHYTSLMVVVPIFMLLPHSICCWFVVLKKYFILSFYFILFYKLIARSFSTLGKGKVLLPWTESFWESPFTPSLLWSLWHEDSHKDFFGCSALLVCTRLTSSALQALFSTILVARKDWWASITIQLPCWFLSWQLLGARNVVTTLKKEFFAPK